MKLKHFYIILVLFYVKMNSQPKKFRIHTVAFYNFENCYDTINDPNVNDEDWLPEGSQHWTHKKYIQKLKNIAQVLESIGTDENPHPPTLIGCSEVENRLVLENLVKQPALIKRDYGIIHFDSPDKRGIDVSLLYQKKFFKPTSLKSIPLYIYKKESENSKNTKIQDKRNFVTENQQKVRIYTRDQLLVTGLLEGEEINIIVNHWPSRSGGEQLTMPYREAAATLNRKIIDSLQRINPKAKIITMGDFNDNPLNKSIKKVLGSQGNKEEITPLEIYNPFEEMLKKGMGTLAYKDAWDIFDQIMFTETFLKKDFNTFQFWKAGIYNKSFLVQKTGRFKGYPLRNQSEEAGFSDHFPVYAYLIKSF